MAAMAAKADLPTADDLRKAEQVADLYPMPEDEPAVDRKRRVARAKVRSRVLRSRNDPNEFMEYCFQDPQGRDLEQEWFHRNLQDDMASGADLLHMMPRNHGKTTQIEGHAIWRLGNNPNLRIKVVCESDNKAVERLFTIIQHLRTNSRIHDVFPWLRPAQLGDWTKHKIVVERSAIMRDASIEACGVLSSATGGRADLLFADDVCGRRNTLEQPKQRETVKASWKSDWTNLLDPPLEQIIWVCTPWHTSDATHMLLKDPTMRQVRLAVGQGDDQFAPLWDRKFDRAKLMKRHAKIGQLEYDRGFRMVALSGDIVVVNPDWIEYWNDLTTPDLSRLQVFIAYDISSGTGTDFFASVILGLDPDTGTIFVLDAWHGKRTFLAQAQAVTTQARSWLPNMQGIERDPMGALLQYLDETTLLNVIPMRPKLSKGLRLSAVTPHLEMEGRVLFNPALRPQVLANPDERGDLVSELTEFPLRANDDLVDAFVWAMTLATIYGSGDDDDDDPSAVDVGVDVVGGFKAKAA